MSASGTHSRGRIRVSAWVPALATLLLLTVANMIQSVPWLGEYVFTSAKVMLYFSIHAAIIISIAALALLRRSWAGELWQWCREFPMPSGMKYAVVIVLLGNLVSIAVGRPSYPFYDVGMFRWTTSFKNAPKTVYKPKYFFWQDGEAKVLDMRREGFFLLAEHFGLRFTHEFTFSANFHNKGQRENFEFIADLMRQRGVDTLWVGVHAVNYATGEVWFDPDICNAVTVNSTEPIHYGPIYIPDYQLTACDED